MQVNAEGSRDELERLRSLTCAKWNYFEADVIPAWVADMDLPPVPAAVEAVRALVDRGDFGYNFAAQGCLAQAFADWEARRHGWRPDVERLRIFCDVMQAVETALWFGTDPGDGVVLLTPVYPPFYSAIESNGRRVIDCPLIPGTWRLDADRLRHAIDDRTTTLLLCNPHNPTGRVFTREELELLAEIAREHDLLVISDEIWADLTHPGATHVPFAPLPDMGQRTVTVSAASKAFNLAGLRCAIADIGSTRIRDAIAALPSHLLGAVGSLAAEATLAAWTSGEEWLEGVRDHLTAQRDHALARFNAELSDVAATCPEGTYLLWLDFRPLDLGQEPAEWLLEHARVALSKGTDFGPHGAGFARLNFATSRGLLDETIDRIVAAVQARG